jgi:spermidine/putrescine transport system substrate-binding protein
MNLKLFLGLLLLPCACPALAAPQQLNLFIWSEYIDPKVVADFEKKFDCKVTVDLYDEEAAMMTKLQGGGASRYDVVVPPDFKVQALIKLELIAPLRRENIPNLKNLDPRFLNPPYDRGNKFTVAYQWGTLGIYVRPQPGVRLPPTWGLVFDPKLQPGPFTLSDSSRDLIGAALKYQGHSFNSTDPEHLKAARDLILAAKKRCLGFENSVGGMKKVLGKSARAAIVFSGEAARGMDDDKATTFIIPQEGSQIWQDNLVVCAKAPHRDLAEKFINFVLEPKIAARISNFTQFATPNQAAKPFINPDDLKDPTIYPPPDLMAKLEFLEDIGSKASLYDEVWTQIKGR